MSKTQGADLRRTLASRVVQPLQLRAFAGPLTIELRASPDRASTIGRDVAAELQLQHPTVSRQHCRVAVLGGQWTITDLGGSNGTFLCGQRLTAHRPTPIHIGDDLGVGACILRVVENDRPSVVSPLTLTQAPGDKISQRKEDDLAPAGRDQMRRLADAAVAIGACATLRDIAERAVEELLAGSRFENAAFVEAAPDLSLADAMVSRSRTGGREGSIPLSGSLVSAALRLTEGRQIVSLADRPDNQWGASIIDLAITTAVAAPMVADGRVVGVLYADTRGGDGRKAAVGDADASFVLGLAQVSALAASRVHGAEIRRRMEDVDRELKAARRAQRAFLPPAEGRVGRVQYTSLFVPGAHVAGDFFDVVAMPDGRVACVLGDVCGHGMAAGLFMASLLTHLRDQLIRGEPLGAAVDSANRLMAALNESDGSSVTTTFATLFAAVIDSGGRRVECVDRGHGYAAIVRAGDTRRGEMIAADAGIPLGIDAAQVTTSVELAMGPEDGLFLFSDGVVEQPGGPGGAPFDVARVLECLASEHDLKPQLAALHLALGEHAGGGAAATFQDDVTVLGLVVGDEVR